MTYNDYFNGFLTNYRLNNFLKVVAKSIHFIIWKIFLIIFIDRYDITFYFFNNKYNEYHDSKSKD